jgi:ABC-2 type transport system ATP-binding protein
MPEVPESTEPVIETHDLSMEYPVRGKINEAESGGKRKLALDRVSLKIHEGEIFGMVGSNGAGKTTLVRLLSTMLAPTSGWARVSGYDIYSQDHAVRKIIGLVTSNERSFYWRLSGRHNLDFFADLYKLPPRIVNPWREEIYDALELRSIIDMRFDHYSTGQKQRLAIARGLLAKPRILLMDEPTKGVDPVGSEKLIRIIEDTIVELWNPTILITSHNLNEIQRLCSRIVLMDSGRIVALGRMEELREMIKPALTYQLTIRGLDFSTLEQVRQSRDDFPATVSPAPNGDIALHITFPVSSEGLAELINSIVHAGGRIMSCFSSEASLDDIFHALISRHRDESQREAS